MRARPQWKTQRGRVYPFQVGSNGNQNAHNFYWNDMLRWKLRGSGCGTSRQPKRTPGLGSDPLSRGHLEKPPGPRHNSEDPCNLHCQSVSACCCVCVCLCILGSFPPSSSSGPPMLTRPGSRLARNSGPAGPAARWPGHAGLAPIHLKPKKKNYTCVREPQKRLEFWNPKRHDIMFRNLILRGLPSCVPC